MKYHFGVAHFPPIIGVFLRKANSAQIVASKALPFRNLRSNLGTGRI
jgi:hypothetical protein